MMTENRTTDHVCEQKWKHYGICSLADIGKNTQRFGVHVILAANDVQRCTNEVHISVQCAYYYYELHTRIHAGSFALPRQNDPADLQPDPPPLGLGISETPVVYCIIQLNSICVIPI